MSDQPKAPREWWIRFEGDPKLDKELWHRYVSGTEFKSVDPSYEVVHVVDHSDYMYAIAERDALQLQKDNALEVSMVLANELERLRSDRRAAADSSERLKSYSAQHEGTIRETMKERDRLAARVAELEECLKHVIRNSPDVVAKKLCSQVLHSEGGE